MQIQTRKPSNTCCYLNPAVRFPRSLAAQSMIVHSNTTRVSISMSTHPASEQPTISRLTLNVTRKLSSQMPAVDPKLSKTLFQVSPATEMKPSSMHNVFSAPSHAATPSLAYGPAIKVREMTSDNLINHAGARDHLSIHHIDVLCRLPCFIEDETPRLCLQLQHCLQSCRVGALWRIVNSSSLHCFTCRGPCLGVPRRQTFRQMHWTKTQ